MFFGGEKITEEFPEEFHIDNTHFGLETPLKFVPLPQNSDAKIFTIDPITKKPVEYTFTEEAHVCKNKTRKFYIEILLIKILRNTKLTSTQKPNQSALCTEQTRTSNLKW